MRSINCVFGRDVKALTVCKAVSDINLTVSMAPNKGTGAIKMREIKWIRPLEIVLYGFIKKNHQ